MVRCVRELRVHSQNIPIPFSSARGYRSLWLRSQWIPVHRAITRPGGLPYPRCGVRAGRRPPDRALVIQPRSRPVASSHRRRLRRGHSGSQTALKPGMWRLGFLEIGMLRQGVRRALQERSQKRRCPYRGQISAASKYPTYIQRKATSYTTPRPLRARTQSEEYC